MKKICYEDEIKYLNNDVLGLVESNQASRNYIRLYRPYENKPLNIVGSFDDAIAAENGEVKNFTFNSKKSFGMVPEKDFTYCKKLFIGKDSPFSSKEKFNCFINSESQTGFCVDKNEFKKCRLYNNDDTALEGYRKALFARCVLAASWVYKVEFKCENQSLINELKSNSYILFEEKKFEKSDNEKIYVLFGRVNNEVLDKYSEVRISICLESNSFIEIVFGDLYTYENAKYIKCSNQALYSGVIPRVCRVEYVKPGEGNNDIHKIVMHLGRTSYLTMFALNYRNTDVLLEHPYLEISTNEGTLKELNKRFDFHEVEAQEQFFKENLQGTTGRIVEDLEPLNRYLEKSWNIHNVNISGNIITQDNYCIYAKRSTAVSDANYLYCSVNGGSEINDELVSYYKNSVQEDIPTICYEKGFFYFGGEHTREAIAELGITNNSPYWKYYGFTVMAGKAKNSDHALWLHFNVLGERFIEESFEQIYGQRDLASEKFENQDIYGYSLSIYKSINDKIIGGIHRIIPFIENLVDLVLSIMVLVMFWCGVKFPVFDVLVRSLTILVFVVNFVYKIIRCIAIKKHKKEIQVNLYNDNWPKVIGKLASKNGEKIDGIFYILTRLRIISI